MLTTFLSIGASVQAATESICAPLRQVPTWLPHVALAGLILTQMGDAALLWDCLAMMQPWLLLPLAGLAILCAPIAAIRRNNV